ncbi:Speckle-type POZ protein-like B [Araneus ventricosus]|uniref:Speckle-type POZ protein-like B n=1 Tax=Araneus ventricosus TaxID=182803 RepID=A0A4Y2BKC3_ARAVE|nr:Speckle-type POZ protein-like B [Araneus ventricosus]
MKRLESTVLQDLSSYSFDKGQDVGPVKTLGMLWDPKVDCLTYEVKIKDKDSFSKREVLSEIGRLYDPLGLIGPIITKAKIFIQGLWKIKLDWSEQLPPDAIKEWKRFYLKLSEVNNLKIQRYILLPGTLRIEIHGFSDASERAYAAVLYMKCFIESGQFKTSLLCSKSRVAPLKTLTIPRLELSAALLLSRLVKKFVPILQLPIDEISLWTDSTIVLAWIKTEPHKLKTFVSNRVAEIQTLTEDFHWKHICSKKNPADLVSRGCHADELLKNDMWFSGADLQTDELEDNQFIPDPTSVDKLKCAVTLACNGYNSEFYDELFNRTNNFTKLIRIVSFIFRFINNTKAKECRNKVSKYLTAEELHRSTEFLARVAQLSEFKAEIDALKKGKDVAKTSKLKALDPFLDENALLRVGGRLNNSDLPFESKHQIILPSKHKFTKLLFEQLHEKILHIGAQGLVHQIRLQYWPINGKGIARKIVHDCVGCFRQRPRVIEQLMGNLPAERVTPSAPFLNSGVDFCGPFQIKFKNQRKGIYSKVYVAIFVCLATKAIRLETVTDLTTEAFIAASKRLCARRGRIATLMSDNASNFKGAASELNRLKKLICKTNETLANYLSSEAIQWKFIPPRSPNFGGLWEAGVKSFKHHLHRTLTNCKITIEEFETIVIQIEGILNSRPLIPLSDNINEYEVLTPGHFIIGRPITAIPEPEILDVSDNRLSRWQYTTKCVQTIWKRWKTDYLNHLQQRNKWQFKKDNVRVGCLVLLKENDLPHCKWAMARILDLIYGNDDNINEYEVLTPGHFIIGRPITAIPEPEILDVSDNRLSRWQYTTKCVQTIWKRWKTDYLNHLQQRNKWQFKKDNVRVGCLVLLKENDLPHCKWAMARILDLIYGNDELSSSREGPEEVTIDYEIALLRPNGAREYAKEMKERGFRKGSKYGFDTLVHRERLLGAKKSTLLPKDILTLQCCIFPKDTELEVSTEVIARTHLEIERYRLQWKQIDYTRNNTIQLADSMFRLRLSIESNNQHEVLTGEFCIDFVADFKALHGKIGVLDSNNSVVKLLVNNFLDIESESRNPFSYFPLITVPELQEDKCLYLPNASSSQIDAPPKKFLYCIDNVPSSLINDFQNLYEEGTLGDFAIKVGDKNFKVHKAVLCARSPVFKGMLTSNMKENVKNMVDISDLEEDTVHRMLTFMYTDMAGNLDWDTAKKLYFAADKYGLITLKRLCSEVLYQNLSVTNVGEVLALANIHADEYLKK